MGWTCDCEAENLNRAKVCTVCGARKPKARLEVVRPSWTPSGPRPCTPAENAGATQVIQAVLARKITLREAEQHLANIFHGREQA